MDKIYVDFLGTKIKKEVYDEIMGSKLEQVFICKNIDRQIDKEIENCRDFDGYQ